MREMSAEERRAFLLEGTRTGHLATVRRDGRPHVAPIWFVLDGDDVVFTTAATSVKGRNLRRSGRAALSVDEPAPMYSYVHLEGPGTISEDLDEVYPWTLQISERYMGPPLAGSYARRNAVAGEWLVRLRPETILARADIAD